MTPVEHGGPVGATITLGSAIVGFATAAIPVLQAVSLLVAIVVGLLTAVWYYKRLKHKKFD